MTALNLPSELLAQLSRAFDNSSDALARTCYHGGTLDTAVLDEEQGALFELAWAQAELAALRALERLDLAARLSPLQQELACAFAAEAIPRLLGRLEFIALDLRSDASSGGPELAQLRVSNALTALRHNAGRSQALARVGSAVMEDETALDLASTDGEVAMARDAFERFARSEVAPRAQEIHQRDLTVPESLLRTMREMGAFGLSIPDTYGGSASGEANARDNALMVAVTEVLSDASLGAAGSLITRPEILARALLAGGTEAQKAHWLPRLASGQTLCAISITEPDYGSDVASLQLAAIRVEGGWRLTGAKTWCTFAGKADVLMVVARTGPDRGMGYRGLSLFLVEKPTTEAHEFYCESPGGGTLTGRAIPTLGYRGMHSYDMAFNGFFVPEANLIGGETGLGRGFYFTMAGMTGGRLQTAGRACGVMRASTRAAIGHVRDRKVFGRALADYPLTRIKIARMAASWLACRALAEAVALSPDRPTHAMEASLAKLLSCRHAEMVTRESLQVHGAMGYAEETPAGRHFVDARVLSIFEGAEETLALKVIARGILEDRVRKSAARVSA